MILLTVNSGPIIRLLALPPLVLQPLAWSPWHGPPFFRSVIFLTLEASQKQWARLLLGHTEINKCWSNELMNDKSMKNCISFDPPHKPEKQVGQVLFPFQ